MKGERCQNELPPIPSTPSDGDSFVGLKLDRTNIAERISGVRVHFPRAEKGIRLLCLGRGSL